jgi:rhodanese-related sulfurtransferase
VKGPRLLVWGLAGVILLAVAIALTLPSPAVREDVTNAQLRNLVARGARLLDVRSPGEFAMGHIQGAENVPVDTITTASAAWRRDAAIVVYCATGARSYEAAQYLAAHGFTKVYNLKAGIVAWDGPVTKSAAAAVSALKTNGKPVFIDFFSPT